MAFRTGSTQRAALEELQSLASSAKSVCQRVVGQIDGQSTINAHPLFTLGVRLRQIRDRMTVLAAVSGLATYAQAQFDDPTYNVVAEYTAMTTTIDACLTWMAAAMAKSSDGYGKFWKVDETWTEDPFAYSTATLAQENGLRDKLAAIIATIE